MRAEIEHEHVVTGVIQRHHLPRVAIHAAFLAVAHDDGADGIFGRNPPADQVNVISALEAHFFVADAIIARRIRRIGPAAPHQVGRPGVERDHPTTGHCQTGQDHRS